MLFQIQSDLHLEMFNDLKCFPKIEKHAPNLCLLGDIGNPFSNNYECFIVECAHRFERVFVIAGNHEYYGTSINSGNSKIQKICEKEKNIFFLNNSSKVIDNIRIIGTTLWSYIPPKHYNALLNYIGDYKNIDRFVISESNKLHSLATQYISSEIQKAKNNNQQVVILTHHAPIMNSAAPKYIGKISQHGYATPLEFLFENEECVKLWAFGHTHWCVNTTIGTTRVVSNCTGYEDENTNQTKSFFTVSI